MITAGVQAGSCSQMFSIDSALASQVARMNKVGLMSSVVTVFGSGFGLTFEQGFNGSNTSKFVLINVASAISAAVRLGHSGCESTVWGSASTARCLVTRAFVAGSRRLALTAGLGMSGSLTSAWSVDALVLNAVNQPHSHTTERRPRQHADMEGCLDADWGLRFRKLQRTWSVPYEHNCCFGLGYVSSFCQFIEFVQCNIEQLHGDYVGIPSTLKLLCVLGRVEWK